MMRLQLFVLSTFKVFFSEGGYVSPNSGPNPAPRDGSCAETDSKADGKKLFSSVPDSSDREGGSGGKNILLILVDDLGWNDVSFHGSSEIPTPNLDALASSGVILQSHYAQPMCTPTRAALLTGLYPFHTGMQNYVIRTGEPWGLPLEFDIIPQYLKKKNYTSHLRGKWHIGMHRPSYLPVSRGFDSFSGYLNGFIDYDTHEHIKPSNDSISGIDWHQNLTPENKEGYATHVLKDEVVGIIEEHDFEQPLFILFSHLAPHAGCERAPFQAPDESIKLFTHIKDDERKVYAAMVHEMDKTVGEVVSALHKKNVLQNTTIIFMSDNGGQTTGPLHNAASNYPFRGQKRTLFEGGTRVAAFVWSADIVNKPRVEYGLMHVTDWLPTILNRAGVSIPEAAALDGVDQWDMISTGAASARREVVYNLNYVDQSAAIRNSRFKFIVGPRNGTSSLNSWDVEHKGTLSSVELDERMERSLTAQTLIAAQLWWKPTTGDASWTWREKARLECKSRTESSCDVSYSPCLFDLKKDPCELNNVISKYPRKAKKLSDRLIELAKTQHAVNNLPADPNSKPESPTSYWKPWLTA